MYIADGKRLTAAGARKIMDDGDQAGPGRRASPSRSRSSTPAGICCCSSAWTAALPHRALGDHQGGLRGLQQARHLGSKGAQGQALDVAHALGLALAAGPERWTAMEGGCPIIVGGECIGGVGVAGGDWEFDERVAREAVESMAK